MALAGAHAATASNLADGEGHRDDFSRHEDPNPEVDTSPGMRTLVHEEARLEHLRQESPSNMDDVYGHRNTFAFTSKSNGI